MMSKSCTAVAAALAFCGLASLASAQNRFPHLPGHDRLVEVRSAMSEIGSGGRIGAIEWSDDAVRFTRSGERFEYRFAENRLESLGDAERRPVDRRRRMGPARGRQATTVASPDGEWNAVCREYNVILEPTEANLLPARPVTTDGHQKLRYGTASWVYGEELAQRSAMWWSHDARRLAYYVFDESPVRDFYLTTGLTEWRTDLAVEGYPKAGEPNPVAGIAIYDVKTRRTLRIDAAPDDWYVYSVRFSPDGDRLLFNRTNRHQNVLELVAADPVTGSMRVVVSEAQRTWQRNRPDIRFLADGDRFLWETEKTGFRHYELRHLDGRVLATLTRGEYPVGSIVKIDEEGGVLFYTAPSGDVPTHQHLHRVGLDGRDDVRLTSGDGSNRAWISPDNQWFIVTTESVEQPPVTTLHAMSGDLVATLAEGGTAKLDELGLVKPERFSFVADDGVTELFGVLYKPSGFDPARRYPLVIDVYGGPQSQRVLPRFRGADPYCELGFLVAVIDNRGTRGRGKAFEEAVYLQCGTVDLKDQADGVRHLAERTYVDGDRVGIFGHSYGGYMSALAILKYPDVFHVAVSSSPVTDWRNYDTIYTERYMRTPQENPDGYDAGSCLTFADQLRGKLLLMHGMIDDNVHPNNVWQLVAALHEAKLPFSMQFFPNSTHGLRGPVRELRWEFLHDHLLGDDALLTTGDVLLGG